MAEIELGILQRSTCLSRLQSVQHNGVSGEKKRLGRHQPRESLRYEIVLMLDLTPDLVVIITDFLMISFAHGFLVTNGIRKTSARRSR
jgi:hypothetical protein